MHKFIGMTFLIAGRSCGRSKHCLLCAMGCRSAVGMLPQRTQQQWNERNHQEWLPSWDFAPPTRPSYDFLGLALTLASPEQPWTNEWYPFYDPGFQQAPKQLRGNGRFVAISRTVIQQKPQMFFRLFLFRIVIWGASIVYISSGSFWKLFFGGTNTSPFIGDHYFACSALGDTSWHVACFAFSGQSCKGDSSKCQTLQRQWLVCHSTEGDSSFVIACWKAALIYQPKFDTLFPFGVFLVWI